jgi:hypothetical protein
MEQIKSYEALELHKYKVKGERIISLPFVKTSAIIAIFLGTSGEFKEIIKGVITSSGIILNEETILKALDLLNMDFAMTLREQLISIIDIALDEYDNDGKFIKKGDCSMMDIEDAKEILDVVIFDIGRVLKNVFGMETKRKASSQRKKEEIPNPSLSL